MPVNPKSIDNLNRKGRITPYKGKKTHEVSVSPEGWEGATAVIKAAGFTSVSQFLEELGRGNVSLLHPRRADKLE